MADELWNVQIGEGVEAGSPGVPPVPTTVYDGDETGAREAYAERSAEAEAKNYSYVLLRHNSGVVESWGTPPAVG